MNRSASSFVLSALSGFASLAGKASFEGLATFGDRMGDLMWYAMPGRRQYTTQTIIERLGVPADRAEQLARASFRHNARSFLEILHVHRFGFEDRGGRLHIAQPDLFDALLRSKRPIVGVTAHLGAWELFSGLLGQFDASRPRIVVVRRQGNPTLNALIMRLRSARGAEVIEHRDAARKVLRGLKHNGMAGFLVDHNCNRREAVFLPFLGKQAAVNVGPALLALRAEAEVWPIFLVREDDRYVLRFSSPLDTRLVSGERAQRIETVAAFYTQAVEEHVRAFPEQWFWMHKRWKTRPVASEAPKGSKAPEEKDLSV